MNRTAALPLAAVAAVLVLTGCAETGPVDAAPAAPPSGAVSTPATTTASASAGPSTTPAPAVTDLRPLDESDPVGATVQRVAELATYTSVMDPNRETHEELVGPVRPLLTPKALARYSEGIPARQEDAPSEDGSSAQLMPTWVTTPTDTITTLDADRLLAGPLKVGPQKRATRPDGTVDVKVTDSQAYRFRVTGPGWAPFVPGDVVQIKYTHNRVLHLVPGTTRGTWLVDDWTGSGTVTSPPTKDV